MKPKIILKIVSIFTFTILLLYNCNKEETKNNKPPTCTILSPNDGDEIHQCDTVNIIVESYDIDGDISEVIIFLDDINLDSLNDIPYNYKLTTSNLDTGYYSIKAISKDNNGNSSSDEIVIKLKKKPESQFETDSITDFEGNVYNTVKIGNQWWMSENLKATKYNSGEPIPNVDANTEWKELSTPAYCWYQNNERKFKNPYGALYNGHTVENDKICPSRWHVPTDADWKQLEKYLGMSESELDSFGFRGSNEAYKLMEKGSDHWLAPNTEANNEIGFTAVASGRREYNGDFQAINDQVYFLSSTLLDTNVFCMRGLLSKCGNIYRCKGNINYGCAIRCIKD